MDDQGSSSTKKKKKRGRSLIFRYLSRKSSSNSLSDDPSSDNNKILASDDNLIYCDVTTNGNGVDSDQATKKSQGRMSKIFKAVLFDTAMKKKMRSKKSIKATSASAGSSPIPYDYPSSENSFNENMLNYSTFEKLSDTKIFSNPDDRSSQIPLSPKSPLPTTPTTAPAAAPATITAVPATTTTVPAAAPPVTPSPPPPATPSPPLATPSPPPAISSPTASTATNPSILQTERKLTPRVDSMKKKPPLPPYSRVESMKKKPTNPATTTTTTRDRKPAQVNNRKSRLFPLIIVLGLFVTVVLWTIYAAKATETSGIDKDPYTEIVTTGDEL